MNKRLAALSAIVGLAIGTSTLSVAKPIVPDAGGTASFPLQVEYSEVVPGTMRSTSGLPAGGFIMMNPVRRVPLGGSEAPGGGLGGTRVIETELMSLELIGGGSMAGFHRVFDMPTQLETHLAPRTPGNPIQSFNTDLFMWQGQLPPGDPDFDLLRITAGTGFGMPSPGHTTLTQAPGGWAVDSFFDITYRIDFVAHPGSVLSSLSGSTTGTTRMTAVPEPATLGALAAGVGLLLRRRTRR